MKCGHTNYLSVSFSPQIQQVQQPQVQQQPNEAQKTQDKWQWSY